MTGKIHRLPPCKSRQAATPALEVAFLTSFAINGNHCRNHLWQCSSERKVFHLLNKMC